jgi:Transposase DDE domain
VAGYTAKILDGNHLAASERRLKELRDVAAGPLPGQTLVVLEPEYQLATDVFCCEDGHAQERSLLDRVLGRVQANDLWLADRNFCTTRFLFGIAKRQGRFLIRQHAATLHWERASEQRRIGRIPEGVVYEQTLWLEDGDGTVLPVRRVSLVLDEPTRDGETEIHVLTNLPAKVGAKRVAQLYRKRWTIEHLFLNLTTILHCELKTLPYPKAALFGFCTALAAGNVLATVKGALRAAHGAEKVEQELSEYHLALEVSGKYQGMMIALPPEDWWALAEMTAAAFSRWLLGLARRVDLKRFPKQRRGPKKPRPRRTRFSKAKHISTARLLAEERSRK